MRMTPKHTRTLLVKRSKDPFLLTWLRLLKVVRKARHHVSGPLEAGGITGPQLALLVDVCLREGSNQKGCAERLQVTKGNIAQHLRRLEGEGLVERTSEGREKALALTPKGHCAVRSVVPAHDAGVRRILGGLSKSELRQLARLLRKIERALS